MYYCLCSRYHYAETFTGMAPRSLVFLLEKSLPDYVITLVFISRSRNVCGKILGRLSNCDLDSNESALSLFIFYSVNFNFAFLNATFKYISKVKMHCKILDVSVVNKKLEKVKSWLSSSRKLKLLVKHKHARFF